MAKPPSQLPPPPSFLDHLQFIKFYMLSDCESPNILYAEMALPIAGQIAVSYLGFDSHSFVKRLIRVPGGRAGRHSRGGRRSGRGGVRGRGLSGIPEISDMVADSLDPHRDMRGSFKTFGSRIIVVFDDVLERAGYMLFLGQVIDDLMWKPFAAILESDKRLCPNIGRLISRSEGGVITPLFQWLAIGMLTNEVNVGYTQSTGFGTTPLFGEHVFTWSGSVRNPHDQPSHMSFRFLRNGHPLEPIDVYMDPGQTASFILDAHFDPGDHIQFEARLWNTGWNYVESQLFFGMQISDE